MAEVHCLKSERQLSPFLSLSLDRGFEGAGKKAHCLLTASTDPCLLLYSSSANCSPGCCSPRASPALCQEGGLQRAHLQDDSATLA